jgi:hypothetical protein
MHERFIRDLAEGLATFMSEVYTSYESLPEKMRREHILLSLQYMQDLAQRSDFDPDLFEANVSQLSKCLSGAIALNEQAMSRHTANFRCEVIRKVLGRLEFDMPSASGDVYFENFPSGVMNGLYSSPESVIDDLADRRNEVAHGSDFDILDIDTLKAISDTVYKFDLWIFRKVAEQQLQALVGREGVDAGHIAHVWSDSDTGARSVAKLTDVSVELSGGSPAYVIGKETLMCTIKEVQRERTRVPSAVTGGGPYGINFGVPVHQNNLVRILPAKWSSAESALRAACLFGLDSGPTNA